MEPSSFFNPRSSLPAPACPEYSALLPPQPLESIASQANPAPAAGGHLVRFPSMLFDTNTTLWQPVQSDRGDEQSQGQAAVGPPYPRAGAFMTTRLIGATVWSSVGPRPRALGR
ncbi:hypothetical protein ABZP36_026921 [Zizania latifolia]